MNSTNLATASRPGSRTGNREPADIRLLRAGLRHWPFPRGRGILTRLFGPRLRRADFVFEVEPGIVVPAELDDYMMQWCFYTDHEKDSAFQLSLASLRNGDTVLDVGGNVGLWAMSAAKRVGAGGSVHAFEPLPGNFARLESNIRLNGIDNIRLHREALSGDIGTATFFAPTSGNSGAGALARHTASDAPVEVEVSTVDTFVKLHGVSRVDFMKVDVEGGEYGVFDGGRELLGSPGAPAIIVEVNEKLSAHFGSSPRAVKALLRELGYRIFVVSGDRLVESDVDQRHDHADIFALKPHHESRFAGKL